MKEKSRLKNSIFNFTSGIGYRILTLLTAFVVRTVFVRCLAIEYLSVNGLYSNILSMLSLAELGFGTAIIYSMYQPLAEGDKDKLLLLIKLYQKVYRIVGTVILVIGLALVPFLNLLVKEAPEIRGLTFYYILFLMNTVASYWFGAYKNSLLQADQKAYIISNYSSVVNIIKSILQIIVLIIFRSFTFYLLSQLISVILQNILIAKKVDNIYAFVKKRTDSKLSQNETKKIFKDVKALMLSKISNTVLNSTDNIIISTFIGFNWVGLLSNFVMITDALTAVLCQVTSSITAGLGNYFATEKKEDGYALFKRVEFLNFWLYGFSMVALVILLNPFVTLWLGADYTLSRDVVVWISINFFVSGFINTFYTFRYTLGLFTQAQYGPVVVTLLNIVLSIALSYQWGMAGVLAATTLSRVCVNLWYDPILVHKRGFDVPVASYFKNYLLRIIILIALIIGLQGVSDVLMRDGVTVLRFGALAGLVVLIANGVFVCFYCKTDEFRYFYGLIIKMIKKMR